MAKEKEVVIYAKIGHPEGLSEAKEYEHHDQYQKDGDRLRVTTYPKSGQVIAEYTSKKRERSDDGTVVCDERSCKVPIEFKEAYCLNVKFRTDKTRFVFTSSNVTLKMYKGDEEVEVTLPGILYEVDVFKKADGINSEWCKIDVEIQSIEAYLLEKYPQLGDYTLKLKISHLPFQPIEPIFKATASSAQLQFVEDLWEKEFRLHM